MAVHVVPHTRRQRASNYKLRQQFNQFLTHLILLIAGFFWVFPFLWTLSGSLKSPGGFFAEGLNLIPQELDLSNYSGAWTDGSFGQFFLNTVFVAVLTVIFTLAISSMAGYVLARTHFPGKTVLIGLIGVTLFLPQGYTIVPIFDVIQRVGLLDSLWSVIIVETSGGLVFATFLFVGYFSTMDNEIVDAARIDGANFNQLFLRVMFPLAGPMLATVALFTFISSWNNFFIPLVFTLGQPDLQTLAVGMYAFIGQHSTNWTYLCAGSVIALGPIMLIFVFLQRYFIDGISGAVKS